MSTNKPFTVLAIFEAKPGKEQALKEVLQALVEPTLQEDGCISYDLHQSVDNPGKFMFYENWVNKAALLKHAESSHIQAWRAKREELLAALGSVTHWEIV